MYKISKRSFIKQVFLTTTALSAGALTKTFANWPAKNFNSKNAEQVIHYLSKNQPTEQSENIYIKAPEIAENGAVVPITVNADLPNVTSISILVDNNPSPLTSIFQINEHLSPYVSTRVKMAKSSNITALVSNSSGQQFIATRNIKVTIGGCGG